MQQKSRVFKNAIYLSKLCFCLDCSLEIQCCVFRLAISKCSNKNLLQQQEEKQRTILSPKTHIYVLLTRNS